MKQEKKDQKEMNYVTNSNLPFLNQVTCPGEKMESGSAYVKADSSCPGPGVSYTDGDNPNAEYVAEDVSYMADYEFSDTGEILAVHYTPVSSAQASWHRNL